jgi:hypothetical protein
VEEEEEGDPTHNPPQQKLINATIVAAALVGKVRLDFIVLMELICITMH